MGKIRKYKEAGMNASVVDVEWHRLISSSTNISRPLVLYRTFFNLRNLQIIMQKNVPKMLAAGNIFYKSFIVEARRICFVL